MPDNQVTFPVARHGTVSDLGRPLGDHDHLVDVAPLAGASMSTAVCPSGAPAAVQFATEFRGTKESLTTATPFLRGSVVPWRPTSWFRGAVVPSSVLGNEQYVAVEWGNVEILPSVVLLVIGAIVGWAGNHFLPLLWRRLTGRSAVDIHVETDPGVFLAGDPNWDAFGYIVPRPLSDLGPPPGHICRDWHVWATKQGGIPAGWSRVRLALSGHLDATVLVDQVRIQIEKRRPQGEGVYVRCRTGGADAVPRGFSVDLDTDPPSVSHVDPGGEPIYAPLAISVAKGEVEIFEIQARARGEVIEWTAELAVVVNGKRKILPVSNRGSAFLTGGTEGLSPHEWSGTEWQEINLG